MKYKIIEKKNSLGGLYYRIYRRFWLFLWEPVYLYIGDSSGCVRKQLDILDKDMAIQFAYIHKNCSTNYKGFDIIPIDLEKFVILKDNISSEYYSYEIMGTLEECKSWVDKNLVEINNSKYEKCVATF